MTGGGKTFMFLIDLGRSKYCSGMFRKGKIKLKLPNCGGKNGSQRP
jgi:hypothetical protein